MRQQNETGKAPFSEPRTSILGTKELFIESGSTINLTCVIHTGGQAMNGKHIFWNYDGKVTQSLTTPSDRN